MGSHNLPLLIIAGIHSLLQSMWDHPIHTPSRPSVLWYTALCLPLQSSASSRYIAWYVGPPNPHPFEAQRPLVHCLVSAPSKFSFFTVHCLVSGPDAICNSLSPLLVDIVLFALFLSGFPSRFLKRIKERFLYFVLLNRCGISHLRIVIFNKSNF